MEGREKEIEKLKREREKLMDMTNDAMENKKRNRKKNRIEVRWKRSWVYV